MRSGKGGGNICNLLPCTQAQFKVFRKWSNLVLMEKRLGMLLFHDLNYGNSSGKEKTWHVSMVSKYADMVGERHTHTNETMLCAKDFRKKITKYVRYETVLAFPDKCFRAADASVPNDSQTGLPHWSYRNSFHSSLTCPSWGGSTSCRLWAGGASTDSSPPRSPSACPSPSPRGLKLLLSLQIRVCISLEVILAKISLLSPDHWVGKWESRRLSWSVFTFPVSLCQLRTFTAGELLGAYLCMDGQIIFIAYQLNTSS